METEKEKPKSVFLKRESTHKPNDNWFKSFYQVEKNKNNNSLWSLNGSKVSTNKDKQVILKKPVSQQFENLVEKPIDEEESLERQ